LERHRQRVDNILEVAAPNLRDQLAAALRTAEAEGPEVRSPVLTTYRRLVEAVADHLFPASKIPHTGSDGKPHDVKQGNAVNRLIAHFESGSAAERAAAAAISELVSRLDRLSEVLSKGVHAEVTRQEMEFGLAQTYFLVGELISFQTDDRT